jgi:two-component system sensor histidine kinase/response regulator
VPAEASRRNLQNLYTLIVDDDLLICEQTQNILKDIGMIGEWVTSGREAIERVQDEIRPEKTLRFHPDRLENAGYGRHRNDAGDPAHRRPGRDDHHHLRLRLAVHRSGGAGRGRKHDDLQAAAALHAGFRLRARARRGENPERRKQEYDFTGKRILVAEDNDLNAEIAKTLLEDKHFAVDRAPNGLKALEKFVQNPEGTYAAILMDVRMPMMDGLQTASNIRHWDRPDAKKIPIVAMTANAFDEDVEKSRAAGMNAHLSKADRSGADVRHALSSDF